MYGQKNAKKRRIFSQCCDLFFGGLSCDVYEPELKLQVTALYVCTGHSVGHSSYSPKIIIYGRCSSVEVKKWCRVKKMVTKYYK